MFFNKMKEEELYIDTDNKELKIEFNNWMNKILICKNLKKKNHKYKINDKKYNTLYHNNYMMDKKIQYNLYIHKPIKKHFIYRYFYNMLYININLLYHFLYNVNIKIINNLRFKLYKYTGRIIKGICQNRTKDIYITELSDSIYGKLTVDLFISCFNNNDILLSIYKQKKMKINSLIY